MKCGRRATVAAVIAALLVMAGLGTAALATPGENTGDKGGPQQGQCEDGIDNDGDRLVDADDPACQQPGCRPSSQTPKKCEEASLDPPVDTCTDGIDNDEDGQTDTADQDCPEGPETTFQADCEDGIDNDQDGQTDFGQDPGCDSLDDDDETNEVDPPTADACTAEAGDPGLLTDDTIGQTVFDAGLSMASPLTEDPSGNGIVSGPVKDGGTGTPLEVVTDEVSCAVDLALDEELGIDP